MRVFRRDVLKRLYPLPHGLNFTPVMSTRAVHEGVRLVEVPISYKERVGRSKLSVARDGTRFLLTIVTTALSYNPVRLLGSIGLALSAIGGIIVAILVGVRIAGITTLGPWGLAGVFAAVVLGIAGVDLFALVLGLRGWPASRLWLYLLVGTMLVLVGIQLIVFWVITRVLDQLSQRDALAAADAGGRWSVREEHAEYGRRA